jgi:D-amino peptidase
MLRFRRHAGFGPIEKGENMSDWCERRRFLTASMVVGLGMVLVGTWSVTSRFCFSEQIGAGPQSAEAAQAKTAKRIFIVTDLEGASGVYQFAQTREAGPLNDMAKEYLMGDIAAVVRGLRAGGATEIVVLDGHGSGAVVPHLMEPGAKYILGRPLPGVLGGLDSSFAGLVFVGQHAMNGVPDGVLCHTQSSRSENRYWYNGVESGELAQCAAIAGSQGVPPILVTGDEAACREAKQFFGDSCVTVSTKQGLSREAAVLYPFEETRQALFEGAKRAMASIPNCKPYRLSLPIQAKKQYLVHDKPGAEPRLVTKEGTIDDVRRLLKF